MSPCRIRVTGTSTRRSRLSPGSTQAVAAARAGAFGIKVIILDKPTAALGVKESNQVLRRS